MVRWALAMEVLLRAEGQGAQGDCPRPLFNIYRDRDRGIFSRGTDEHDRFPILLLDIDGSHP